MKIKFVKSMQVFNSEMRVVKFNWFVSGSDDFGPIAREYKLGTLPKYVMKFLKNRQPEMFSTEKFNDGSIRVTHIYRR